MSRMRPINIFYEIIIFTVLLAAINYLFIAHQITRTTWADFHLYWNPLLFLVLLSSINVRVYLKQQKSRRFISTFCFGFIISSYQWSIFAINEFISIDMIVSVKNIAGLVIGVMLAGVIGAFATSVISILIYGLIQKMDVHKRKHCSL